MDLLARKKQENIADYVISMWHIEDLMRASRFDMSVVEDRLIAPIDGDAETRAEVREWYADIVARMQEEGIEQQGHLNEVEEVMDELEYLHRSIINERLDEHYVAVASAASPGIKALQGQAGEDARPEIETCFTAVYGVMVLRAQDRTISEATLAAERSFRQLLERLSEHYKHLRKLPGVSLN
ncbi:MAG: DUF4924 family protein [Flavobacteriales bacterium]